MAQNNNATIHAPVMTLLLPSLLLLLVCRIGTISGETAAAPAPPPATAMTAPAIRTALRQASSLRCEERWTAPQCNTGGGEFCCEWQSTGMLMDLQSSGCVHLEKQGCEAFAPAPIAVLPAPAPVAPGSIIVGTMGPSPDYTTVSSPTGGPNSGAPAGTIFLTTDPPSPRPTTGMPTREPTGRPTRSPTGGPTAEPSSSPSTSPSKGPTAGPTASPTARPTARPTESPTPSPSAAPSASPTYQPTASPTQSPTISGLPTPLIWPSASPTISTMPSAPPTRHPTTYPTARPTRRPTARPTGRPVTIQEPTDPPAALQTPSPTTGTTIEATIPLREYAVESVMMLYGAYGEMDRSAGEAWTEETEDRIREATTKIMGDEEEGLVVNITSFDQQIVESGRRRTSAVSRAVDGRSRYTVDTHPTGTSIAGRHADTSSEPKVRHKRGMQSLSPLQIDFNVSISFSSDREDWDQNQMVAAAFRSPADQAAYISSLRGADYSSFRYVDTMAMEVEGELITEVEGSNMLKPPKDYTMYYIIGGAVGGGLLFLLACGICYMRSKKKDDDSSGRQQFAQASSSKSHQQDQPTAVGSRTSQPPPPHDAFDPQRQQHQQQQEQPQSQSYFGTLNCEGEDDVSTLGDPYFGEGVNNNPEPQADDTVGESMISSEQEMFVFGVNRGRLNTGGGTTGPESTVTGGTRGDNPTRRMIFGDDHALEDAYQSPTNSATGGSASASLQRLVVVAPAGRIGIVIDNRTGDLPVVHGVKETSVLHGRVVVGDLLISVDEVDCRGMSAVQVSRLISSRSQQPARTLALLRST